jgi:predicted metalloprotease
MSHAKGTPMMLSRIVLPVLLALLALTAAAPADALNPQQRRPDGVTAALMPSLDAFWSGKLASAGRRYVSPTGVHWYSGRTPSACGLLEPDNSYFCGIGADRRIYLDWGWHWSLVERFGDYGSGYVLAHEWAHHVQKLLGWYDWALERRYFAGLELQADCYAGIYTGHAYTVGLAGPDDVDEAFAWLHEFGDDHHWKSPYAHGNSWLRETSFEYGFQYMNMAGCDLTYKRLYGAAPKHAAKKQPKPRKPAKPRKKHAQPKHH